MKLSTFKLLMRGSCLASVLLLGATLLSAEPITYTFSGTGTGAIGTSNFTDASFVVTINSDTTNVGYVPFLGTTGILGLPATIDISGVGTEIFTGNNFIYRGNFAATDGWVGFGESWNLFELVGPSLFSYGLTTDLTVTGINGKLAQDNNISTSGGLLSFRSMTPITFQSDVPAATPEPSS